MEVSLMDILNAREERVRMQEKLLQNNQCPLICFTMNIAGPIKNTPLIQRGFQAGLEALLHSLPNEHIKEQWVDLAYTGCTAMLSVNMDAAVLKEICVRLEERNPLGRLFDMDVLEIGGKKQERTISRSCLVCHAPGRECAASRRHSVSQLQAVTNHILQAYFADSDEQFVANLAVQSLIDEVNTTPKPGLVDQRNNGSHLDMSHPLFLKSADALHPYFAQCFKIGRETAKLSPCQTFPFLRAAGLEAEKAMYRATNGINTHKGIIYTMGILCASLGRLWAPETPFADVDSILSQCSMIVKESVTSDLASADGITPGQRCYLQYGIGGVRQEVANGLPSVREIGLPCYEDALSLGMSPNDAGAITLVHLIAKVADTNLYHRGGESGAKWAANAASALLPRPAMWEIEALDDSFIERNLSPGGCADLLAVTYFLHALK